MFLALTAGLTAAAAAAYAGYASMAPHPQLYGRTLARGGDPRQIALTFDDGPNDPHTLHLLDLLDRHEARATFFLIGKYVRQRPDIARAIRQAGHALGNHTYNHPNLIFCSPGRVLQELQECRSALEDAVGESQPLFRPPFGGRLPHVLRAARSLGLLPVMWSVTAYDWNAKSADAIIATVLRQMHARKKPAGEIILLHDGSHLAFAANRAYTVQATQHLLQKFSAEAKEFVSIPGLASEHEPPKSA